MLTIKHRWFDRHVVYRCTGQICDNDPKAMDLFKAIRTCLDNGYFKVILDLEKVYLIEDSFRKELTQFSVFRKDSRHNNQRAISFAVCGPRKHLLKLMRKRVGGKKPFILDYQMFDDAVLASSAMDGNFFPDQITKKIHGVKTIPAQKLLSKCRNSLAQLLWYTYKKARWEKICQDFLNHGKALRFYYKTDPEVKLAWEALQELLPTPGHTEGL